MDPLKTLARMSCVALAAGMALSPSASAAGPRTGDVVEGSYIVVVYEKSVRDASDETRDRERKLGFTSGHRFGRALEGFSARLGAGQLKKLRDDPEVAYMSENRRVRASGFVPLAAGDTAPTGVRRINAGTASTAREASGVGVAVIDTGIDLTHSDLDAADGTDCISPGSSADDDNGHGTHVAGTIGARNNGAGVVGVAPGTKTHAVKVLDSNGDGTTASVVCGIDWATANAASLGIKVANMSLSGLGSPVGSCAATSDPMHAAICNSTAAGVTYVVAAGNDGWDFDLASQPNVPAAYPQVLTVSALSDSDGLPGDTGGSPGCRLGEGDDDPASFSNFAFTAAGRAHTIAAPGVCITSTWHSGSGYNTISGTSMASPHMAGVVALCMTEGGAPGPCASMTPAQVISYMRSEAEARNTADPGYGFSGDPLHSPSSAYYGFLQGFVTGADAPPETFISSGPSGSVSSGSASFAFASTQSGSTFQCRLDGGAWHACSSPQGYSGLASGAHVFGVRATGPNGQTDPTEATRSWTVTAPPGGASTSAGSAAPARARFTGSKRSIRVRRGRFTYTFRAGPRLRGRATFKSVRRVRVNRRVKAFVTLARKSFTVPGSGRVTLRIKLSKRSLRILRRNRRIRVRVTVTLRNAAGRTSTATRTLTLRI